MHPNLDLYTQIKQAAPAEAPAGAFVLATVVAVRGTGPREAGAQMFVTDQGTFGGSVSGGCVELEIREEASGILSSVSQEAGQEAGQEPGQKPGPAENPGKKTRWLRYGIEDATAWSVGLPCGGTLFIALEYVPDTSYVPKSGDLPCVRPIRLDGLASRPLGVEETGRHYGLPEALRKKLRRGESLLLDAAGLEAPPERACLYLHVLVPPAQLVVIGGTHISQVLLPLAEQLGYETVLIEAREAWGHPDRFPGRPVLREWPEKALTQLDLHGWTALVAVTHDAKMDDPALERALQSPCFYIGALGSKRTHAQRLERLAARGLTPTALDRIHGPVGLDIGGKRPEDIALSILAHITAVRHGKASPSQARERPTHA